MPYKRKYGGDSYSTPKKSRRTIPARSRRRPVRGRASIARIAKQVQMKTCETKKSSQYTATPAVLFHNLNYYAANLCATTQGFGDPEGLQIAERNRIGDEVIGRGVSLKLFIANKSDRPNVSYRVIVFRYNALINPTQIPMDDAYFWSGTDGAGANMNRMLDKPDMDHITVIKSKTFRATSQANYSIQTAGPVPVGPFEKTHQLSFWIPLKNRRIKYSEDNGNFPRYLGLGFAVLAYDTMTTLETDQLATFQWVSTFYYKDP